VTNGTEIPYRILGHTGEKVSCIGMGGYHLGFKSLSASDAIQLIHSGVDHGINFLDNSWDYNKGESERRMGRALKQSGYRNRVFLMTKIDGRTKDSAAKQIDESLRRLRTDRIDLVQFHEIIRFDDPDRIFAQSGAIEAALEAKSAGKIRYIGFTGHKDPRIHLYMLEVAEKNGFVFDAAQMPINVMDAHFRSFVHLVVPELVKRNIAVLGMKSMGDGVILKSGLVTPLECLHFALSTPASVVITGIDKPEILDQALTAAQTHQEITEEQIRGILAKTAEAAEHGEWELFKTSDVFDSTAKNLKWLGGVSPHVQAITPAAS
jgi:aryl-alcohol dehydrogenase-like predicted oxidoreductase